MSNNSFTRFAKDAEDGWHAYDKKNTGQGKEQYNLNQFLASCVEKLLID